jgi:Ca2+-binding RTX toxin-like protein
MQTIHGTVNVDVLRGKVDEENEIWGHSGADDLNGGAVDDVVIGGRGDDRLWGDRGNDRLIGDSGNDTGFGSVDDDALFGGTGNDWLSGGKNDDSLFGGRDNDELHGNSGTDALSGGSGNDTLRGESGDDVLFGGWGTDDVRGGTGNDFVMASKGIDTLVGGTGYDTVDFSRMTGMLNLDLSKHSYTVGTGGNAGALWGFEEVYAGNGGSRILGSDAHGTTIHGGDGEDWIRGKMGADVLSGGQGADTFAYLKKDTRDGSVDRITDFEVGIDKLDLSDFLKGGRTADSAIRFVDSADGALVQGLVGGQWTDVVALAGVQATDIGYTILA